MLMVLMKWGVRYIKHAIMVIHNKTVSTYTGEVSDGLNSSNTARNGG